MPKPPRYRLMATVPLAEADDERGESHLARQAAKRARYVDFHFADYYQKKRRAGLALTVIAERGNGKSSWLQFFKQYLRDPKFAEKTPKENEAHPPHIGCTLGKWITIHIGLVPLLNMAENPRAAAAPFALIAKELERLHEDFKKNRQLSRDDLERFKCLLSELERAANGMAMDHDTAGQAAIAFSTDEKDFARIYSELTLHAANSLEKFCESLRGILNLIQWFVLLVLDDVDLVTPRHAIAPVAWATLYLSEHAPVCRVLAIAPDRERALVTSHPTGYLADTRVTKTEETLRPEGWPAIVRVSPEYRAAASLLRKALGDEVRLGPMNEIRKMQFLGRPRPTDEDPLDGRMVWSEAISEAIPFRGEAAERHEDLIKAFTAVDWCVRLGSNIEKRDEYEDVLFTNEELRSISQWLPQDERRKEQLALFLQVFPSNRRLAVEVTNNLINQREQALSQELSIDRRLPWTTSSHRLYRALMCIGFRRWRNLKLADLLWQKPDALLNELGKAIQATKNPNNLARPTVTIQPDVSSRFAGDLQELQEAVDGRLPEPDVEPAALSAFLRLLVMAAEGIREEEQKSAEVQK